ncbi:MAG: plasmid mobilization relaxosome protein MobC [Gammaproteobacteria bacterium]|nr:plasmid mobilization relaxosome protein MobC [Gammaproteobacteria bacterium]
MARPPKPAAERLDARLHLRLSSEMLARWRDAARAADLSLAEWLRAETGSGVPARRRRPPPVADPKLLAAIARVGNNVNQLARSANRNQWPHPIALLPRLIAIERALKNLLPASGGPASDD